MNPIHESPYIVVSYDAPRKTVHVLWTEKTAEMDESAFRAETEAVMSAVEKHSAKATVGDTRAFAFAMNPEVMGWFETEIFPRQIKAGLEKVAMVYAESFAAYVPSEPSVFTSEGGHTITTAYFPDEESAWKWVEGA